MKSCAPDLRKGLQAHALTHSTQWASPLTSPWIWIHMYLYLVEKVRFCLSRYLWRRLLVGVAASRQAGRLAERAQRAQRASVKTQAKSHLNLEAGMGWLLLPHPRVWMYVLDGMNDLTLFLSVCMPRTSQEVDPIDPVSSPLLSAMSGPAPLLRV
jgi:hypothetical protein